jgi:RNA polymerase sigma-70 factor (ECF subfamily)
MKKQLPPGQQLKFLFFAEINQEYAMCKKAERARLHEAVKAAQDKRRMESLITTVQLQLCFECSKNDNEWWYRICGFRNEMMKTALHYRRREDAEDIVSDALIVAHEKRSLFREENKLKGWLCTITKNLALNHIQREKTRLTVNASDSLLCDRESPDGLIESFSIIKDINLAMSKLPEVTRDVVRMRMEGYSQKEIRSEVARSKSAVGRHISKAKQILKVELGAYSVRENGK